MDKITFIIPSVNRPSLKKSVQSLLDQTNPNWECIIIYDGVDGEEFLDERIKTIKIEKIGNSINNGGQAGLVRNVGIKMVKTDWIGFLDDDDTISPYYVQTLFEKYTDFDVVVWRMKYKNGEIIPKQNSVEILKDEIGISFCYKNKFENIFFIENSSTEDFNFLYELYQISNNVVITPEIFYYVDGSLDYSDKPNLTWLAKFDDYTSMGILSQRILENIEDHNSHIELILGETKTNNLFIHKLYKKEINYDLGIMFSYPDQYQLLSKYRTKVIYTGADTTGGISNFAYNCNQVDFLLTPSNLSKRYMENLGVTKPIFVFPHGIDPNLFYYKRREPSNVFKFLYVGECSDRKGIFQLLKSFISNFENNKFVELHIKSNNDMLFYGSDKINDIIKNHSNIFWHTGNEGHNNLIELYDKCHVYVYPSRADTFGMTVLEAMACGLPVISTKNIGVSELIQNRFYEIESKMVNVENHPWMLGEWSEPSIDSLKKLMNKVYEEYDKILESDVLKDNSDYVIKNYNWSKLTKYFETEILPKFRKKNKIITLLISNNDILKIEETIKSLKNINDEKIINHTYIVENSSLDYKDITFYFINRNIDENFKVYNSDFDLGQRGSLLQLLEDINIDDYDYVQFIEQGYTFDKPISDFCDIISSNPDIKILTGLMNGEHTEMGWRDSKFGKLCEKRSCRSSHMILKTNDLKTLLPIHLDSQYGEPHNSSYNLGLDWEIQYWNKNAFGRKTNNNFILCYPNSIINKFNN